MDTQAPKTPHGSNPETHILLAQLTATIGGFIREKDFESLDWFLGQLKGMLMAAEELAAQEQGNSSEVH